MSRKRSWKVKVNGNLISCVSRVSALRKAIEYANLYPNTPIPVLFFNGRRYIFYTQAEVQR